jgi:hypothetical protein
VSLLNLSITNDDGKKSITTSPPGEDSNSNLKLADLRCFTDDESAQILNVVAAYKSIFQDETVLLLSLLLSVTNCGDGSDSYNPFCFIHFQGPVL